MRVHRVELIDEQLIAIYRCLILVAEARNDHDRKALWTVLDNLIDQTGVSLVKDGDTFTLQDKD